MLSVCCVQILNSSCEQMSLCEWIHRYCNIWVYVMWRYTYCTCLLGADLRGIKCRLGTFSNAICWRGTWAGQRRQSRNVSHFRCSTTRPVNRISYETYNGLCYFTFGFIINPQRHFLFVYKIQCFSLDVSHNGITDTELKKIRFIINSVVGSNGLFYAVYFLSSIHGPGSFASRLKLYIF